MCEIQFADYFYPASDQIVSEAARLRYRSNEFIAPMTIRMPCGGGIYGGQTHSQSPEAMFAGLRPARGHAVNPYDAKGLLIAAIENDDPVIFLEPKRLYNSPFDGHHDRPVTPWTGRPGSVVPTGYYTVPLDSAAIVRPGNALTVLTYGTTVHVSLTAAEETGIDAEVIDLRSLWPLDLDTIVNSVKKTGRCVVVHEATRTCGFGAELIALVQEHCFHHLEAPVERVTGWDTPYPHAQEWAYFRPAPGWRKRSSARWRVERMGIHVIKMPDIGEGIAEVELVAWHVKVGDMVAEDQPLADVMTDKATVEIPAPVVGRVVALGGEVGQVMAVGGELIRLEVDGEGNLKPGADAPPAKAPAAAAAPLPPRRKRPSRRPSPPRPWRPRPPRPPRRHRPSPRGKRRRRRASARRSRWPRRPCASAPGTWVSSCATCAAAARPAASCTRIWTPICKDRARRARPVAAWPMPSATTRKRAGDRAAQEDRAENGRVKRRIPHFSYVEEIDVTELEAARQPQPEVGRHARQAHAAAAAGPLVVRCAFPQINARYDDEAGVVTRHGAHIGIATQSDGGLMVPVMRHAEARDLWSMAAEIIRLAEAVRTGAASRDELSGSTIPSPAWGRWAASSPRR